MSDNGVLVPASPCVECGKVMDGAANSDKNGQRTPDPGDFSICIYCGSLNVFDDNLKLRQPTIDEYVESTHSRVIQLAREFIVERNLMEKSKMSQK